METKLSAPNDLIQIQLQPKLSLDLHPQIGEDEEASIGVVDVLELEKGRHSLARRVPGLSVLEEVKMFLRLRCWSESSVPVCLRNKDKEGWRGGGRDSGARRTGEKKMKKNKERKGKKNTDMK